MKNRREKLEAIFETAAALETDAQRHDYLERACPDAELRKEVESLLDAMKNPDSLFDQGDTVSASTLAATPVLEQPGTMIGRYKLLQKVGEGGMGVVYMAEQTEPVVRKVALKIIKLGMDTKQVVARFEAERQALAMMDHPNIAKVLDAGATDTGRPYFVMELVRGVPITEYCDKNKLSTQERLNLFIPVCQAIQHAHQKGVIHRDIKPSNVMVTLNDGEPHPMVIDFGIAKATNQKLTEKTLFTNYAQMIGTPAYMSPEQAEMSKLDVDTRTDVYSLGVLLYELLTGTTPFPSKELLSMGYGEMQRVIAEKEPPKPSTRMSTMQGEELTVTADKRSVEVVALRKQFQGDLDWIVMKALEKDRTHRYETVNGLVSDIRRHLDNEPVSAAAPTFSYQFHKFYRRNRKYMRVAAVIAALLVLAASFATFQAVRATRASQLAEAARRAELKQRILAQEKQKDAETARERAVTAEADSQAVYDFLWGDVLSQFNPGKNSPGGLTIQTVLDRACQELDRKAHKSPLVEARIRSMAGRVYGGIGLHNKAVKQLSEALPVLESGLPNTDLEIPVTQEALAAALVELRRTDRDLVEASRLLQSAAAFRTRVQGEGHPDSIRARLGLAFLQFYFGNLKEMHRQLEELRQTARHSPLIGADDVVMAEVDKALGEDYSRNLRVGEAGPLLKHAIQVFNDKLGPDHPNTLEAERWSAVLLIFQFRYQEGAAALEGLLPRYKAVFGEAHSSTVLLMDTLVATYLACLQDPKGAAPLVRQLVEICRSASGPNSVNTARALMWEGLWSQQTGDLVTAERTLRKAVKTYEALSSPQALTGFDQANYAWALSLLGGCLIEKPNPGTSELNEAEELLLHCAQIHEKQDVAWGGGLRAASLVPIPQNLARLVRLYELKKEPEKAAVWRDKLSKLEARIDAYKAKLQ
ncbi:protein kinase [bacterium]|nr:protein kinase [bacterium]